MLIQRHQNTGYSGFGALGIDYWTYTNVATGATEIYAPAFWDPMVQAPGAYSNGQFAWSDTNPTPDPNNPGGYIPTPDTSATNWLSTIPIIGNFLVQTGIVHPSPKGYGVPPPGGFKQPTSNLTTYMIIGGIGIGGLLLVKMLMKKS